MKITEKKTGEAYHLTPGTKLEIERTNLFFNEYGEQSLPIDLPATDRNRRILGYPDMLSKKKKLSADIEVSIEDSGFYSLCRQAILSITQREKISTAFYLNEGSFLAKINDTALSEIFGEERIEGINTVDQAISFCRELIKGKNPDYAIFPVLIDSDESYPDGTKKYKFINRFGYQRDLGWDDSPVGNQVGDFYNAVQREEKVGENNVYLPAGFYISPFIRANYLIKRILQYYGYTLKDNFFTQTYPFMDMVIINNTADTIVKGTIRIQDLLPDCTVATILNVFRKKFCCEFLVDEATKVVDICLFKEVIKATPQMDVSKYIVGNYEIDFPEIYKKIVLRSEQDLSENSGNVQNVGELLNKFPGVYFNSLNGTYYRSGYVFIYNTSTNEYMGQGINETVATAALGYDSVDSLDAVEITVPDLFPEFRRIYVNEHDQEEDVGFDLLYIGGCRFLNSSVINTPTELTEPLDNTLTESSENEELKPILAFFYNTPNWAFGTITNYGYVETSNGYMTRKFSDYTLCYWGENSLYDNFYLDFDSLHRNSLHEIKAKLMLPVQMQQSIKSEYPIMLLGQKVLFNSFNYVLGGNTEPSDSSFFTIRPYEPITYGLNYKKLIEGTFNPETLKGYVWKLHNETIKVNDSEYDELRTSHCPMFLSLYPSEKYADGKHYFEQTWYHQRADTGDKYRNTFWCECEYVDWSEGWG